MSGWVSPDEPVLAAATAVARELSDPIRLTVLQLLASEGPHGMTQLADILGVAPARLGNHLARLRASGLIAVEHRGRHATYRIASSDTAQLLTALASFAGGILPHPDPVSQPTRTCYDHAAGRIGTGLLDMLIQRQALTQPAGESDELTPGPGLKVVLAEFGIELATLAQGRRKLATQCLDRNLRVPHLGGALGAALLDALTARGYTDLDPQTRQLSITARGRDALPGLIPSLASPDRLTRNGQAGERP